MVEGRRWPTVLGTRYAMVPVAMEITGVREESSDTVTIWGKIRVGEKGGRASDALELATNLVREFAPGQFGMLGYPGVGEVPISLSSLPEVGDEGVVFGHTVRAAGRVTEFILARRPGDTLQFRGPFGRGWPIEAARGRDLILVGGGIGIAPLRPVIQTVMARRGEFGRFFILYGTRTPVDIVFKDELVGWRRIPDTQVLMTVDEVPAGRRWDGAVGVVTSLFDHIDIDLRRAVTFVCGPEIMMRFTAGRLRIDGQSPGSIYLAMERRMRCAVAQCGHCQIREVYVCKDGPVFRVKDLEGLPDTLL